MSSAGPPAGHGLEGSPVDAQKPVTGSEGSSPAGPDKRQCSLLLFLATPAEEQGLREAAAARGVHFETIKKRHSPFGEDYHWLGRVGYETVIAVRPARDEDDRLVMGSIGHFGTAARGMRMRVATGAQAIVQLGMAFGVNPQVQRAGDVLVSTSIIPYDNRDMKPDDRSWLRRLVCGRGYRAEYAAATRVPARPSRLDVFGREQRRGGRAFNVFRGALLSGAARIHTRVFRDELMLGVPSGEDPVVGGEMEGVGLLAASTAAGDPVWCIVRGISDFADEDRDAVIGANRPVACRNAAEFVLAALTNDAAESPPVRAPHDKPR